jgi:di/tripeptidase
MVFILLETYDMLRGYKGKSVWRFGILQLYEMTKKTMTNYINEEILCEAYTKLDIDIYHDKQKLANLENNLKAFFSERAKFYLGEDVKIKIEFEEGSLITKLKVVGGATALLASAVGAYGSFRDGVFRISEDATTLAQSANLEVIFRTKTAYCDRIDSERRKGVFGRVDELIRKLDSVNEKVANSKLPNSHVLLKTFNSYSDALIAWDTASDKFFAKLTDNATRACISAGLLEELEKMPTKAPWIDELNGNGFRVTIAKADPNLVGLIEGTAARYAATIRTIKKSMRQRVDLYAPAKG